LVIAGRMREKHGLSGFMSPRQQALTDLLGRLTSRGYRFVTPGNATIRTIRSRPDKVWAADLRDVFGWSLPFRKDLLDEDLLGPMRAADILEEAEGGQRSALRVSSIGEALFLHSAFPTTDRDAVFFGPDTYRYVRFLRERLPRRPSRLVVDIGAGGGPGGICLGLMEPQARILLTDVNRAALELAQVNARFNGVAVECLEGEGLEPVREAPDLVIANPPFIAASEGQTYQEGGDAHGSAVSAAWAQETMRRLVPGGRMLLYTGSAIVDGGDPFRQRLAALAREHDCSLDYEEIDPDIFGDELRRDAYAGVERLAAVGAVIRKAG
jgi:methylase of polypeptide subunit release factors